MAINAKILIVDDDLDICEYMETMLRLWLRGRYDF